MNTSEDGEGAGPKKMASGRTIVLTLPSAAAVRSLMGVLLMTIPFIVLGIRIVSWLRHGVDYPWQDDWRPYQDGVAGQLNLGYLFAPENNTLAPVGKALDSLAQRLLGGNAVAYQAISMALVLGTFLVTQAVLLRRALTDALAAGAVLVLALLSLRATDSYWAGPNNGYHQALPLIFILITLVIATTTRVPSWLTLTAAAGLGLASGLTYVSGAGAGLCAGVAMLVVGALQRSDRGRSVRVAGLGLAGASTVALIAQVVAVTRSSLPAEPLAMPWTSGYLQFILGMVADSLMLPTHWGPGRLALIALIVVVFVVVTGLLLLYRSASRPLDPSELVLSTVYLTLAATLLGYVMLLTAGRLAYALQLVADTTLAGYVRFYQWWLTVLWPWLLAVPSFYAIRWAVARRGSTRSAAVGEAVRWGFPVIALAIVLAIARLAGYSGAMAFDAMHSTNAAFRLAQARCVGEALVSPGPSCSIHGYDDGLIDAVLYASDIDASFVNSLPLPEPLTGGELLHEAPAGTVPGGPTAIGQWRMAGADTVTQVADGVRIRSAGNVWLGIAASDVPKLAACQVLEVEADVQVEGAAQVAQLLYFPPGSSSFREAAAVVPEGPVQHRISFALVSRAGFGDVRLRPAGGATDFTLGPITLSCHRVAA